MQDRTQLINSLKQTYTDIDEHRKDKAEAIFIQINNRINQNKINLKSIKETNEFITELYKSMTGSDEEKPFNRMLNDIVTHLTNKIEHLTSQIDALKKNQENLPNGADHHKLLVAQFDEKFNQFREGLHKNDAFKSLGKYLQPTHQEINKNPRAFATETTAIEKEMLESVRKLNESFTQWMEKLEGMSSKEDEDTQHLFFNHIAETHASLSALAQSIGAKMPNFNTISSEPSAQQIGFAANEMLEDILKYLTNQNNALITKQENMPDVTDRHKHLMDQFKANFHQLLEKLQTNTSHALQKYFKPADQEVNEDPRAFTTETTAIEKEMLESVRKLNESFKQWMEKLEGMGNKEDENIQQLFFNHIAETHASLSALAQSIGAKQPNFNTTSLSDASTQYLDFVVSDSLKNINNIMNEIDTSFKNLDQLNKDIDQEKNETQNLGLATQNTEKKTLFLDLEQALNTINELSSEFDIVNKKLKKQKEDKAEEEITQSKPTEDSDESSNSKEAEEKQKDQSSNSKEVEEKQKDQPSDSEQNKTFSYTIEWNGEEEPEELPFVESYEVESLFHELGLDTAPNNEEITEEASSPLQEQSVTAPSSTLFSRSSSNTNAGSQTPSIEDATIHPSKAEVVEPTNPTVACDVTIELNNNNNENEKEKEKEKEQSTKKPQATVKKSEKQIIRVKEILIESLTALYQNQIDRGKRTYWVDKEKKITAMTDSLSKTRVKILREQTFLSLDSIVSIFKDNMRKSLHIDRNPVSKFLNSISENRDHATTTEDKFEDEINQLLLYYNIIHDALTDKTNDKTLDAFLNPNHYLKKLCFVYVEEIYFLEKKNDRRNKKNLQNIFIDKLSHLLLLPPEPPVDKSNLIVAKAIATSLIDNLQPIINTIQEKIGPFLISTASNRIQDRIEKIISNVDKFEKKLFETTLERFKSIKSSSSAMPITFSNPSNIADKKLSTNMGELANAVKNAKKNRK